MKLNQLDQLARHYPDLKIISRNCRIGGVHDEYTVLQGSIPATFKKVTYNFATKIWLPYAFPQDPPRVRAAPTEQMRVRPSEYVSETGKAGFLSKVLIIPEFRSHHRTSKAGLFLAHLWNCATTFPHFFRTVRLSKWSTAPPKAHQLKSSTTFLPRLRALEKSFWNMCRKTSTWSSSSSSAPFVNCFTIARSANAPSFRLADTRSATNAPKNFQKKSALFARKSFASNILLLLFNPFSTDLTFF
jgi:hypothetical protein